MIVNGIVNIIASFFRFLINPIQAIEWFNFDNALLNTFFEFLRVVIYFFPIEYISPLISIVIGIVTYKCVISILQTIWQVLPLL